MDKSTYETQLGEIEKQLSNPETTYDQRIDLNRRITALRLKYQSELDNSGLDASKAVFLPDFKRAMAGLEEKLKDPNLSFPQRTALMDQITSLKAQWVERGIVAPELLLVLKDSLIENIGILRNTGFKEGDSVLDDCISHLAEVEKIISKAQAKGVI